MDVKETPTTREQALAVRAFRNQQRAERAESRVAALEAELSQIAARPDEPATETEGGTDDD